MDKINLMITIASITIFIALFLSFFLITTKSENKLSNYLFSTFLILTAIDTSGLIFDTTATRPYNLLVFRSLMSFLQTPVFYLYVLSVCYSDFKLKKKHLIHIAAFLLANLIFLPNFYLVDLDSKINFLTNNRGLFEIQFNHVLFHLQTIVYIVAIFIVLRRVKKLYLENFTGINIKFYEWLFQFTIALSFLYSTAFFKNIFKFSAFYDLSNWLKIGIHVLFLMLICWYLFKLLNNPNLFRKIDSKLRLVKELIKEEKETIQLAEKEIPNNKDLLSLKNYMAKAKPFLNSSLTIQNISDEIQIPVRDLSLLINHKMNQHFYDFINTYRIEHAITILKDTTKNHVTILEILYEAGFNSKSSFNTAFKKHTGTTPTLFRKSLINKA